MPTGAEQEDTMSDTETPTTETAYKTDVFAPGEIVGVCQFPTGPDAVCGNPVYANTSKGRLPRYCGQPEQAQWQQEHGSTGVAGHLSDRAGYPRKQFGMSTERAAELAAIEAKARGYGNRRLKTDPAPAAAPAVPAETTAVAVAELPADLSDALAALYPSPIAALAELARLTVGRAAAARAEMDELRAGADNYIEDMEVRHAAALDELAEQRAALEADRAEAQATTEEAKKEIEAARDSRNRLEGQLGEARDRIAELERRIEAMRSQHQDELEEVRAREEARLERILGVFALTAKVDPTAAAAVKAAEPETPADPPAEQEVTAPAPTRRRRSAAKPESTEAGAKMLAPLIARGLVIRTGDMWQTDGSPATTGGAETLDHMLATGLLVLEDADGDKSVARLTEEGAKLAPPWQRGGKM
ncbi:hypothetical protein AB0H71_33590 [Nocardia sp. NPDC050697]|uniref:hypothetical protein n=1 Tax=Nocardia sp. NPDC050697 TaxID=3155158 RepID=UPI0033C1AAA7